MFYLELVSGLRKNKLVALLWSDLDVENQTISVSTQATHDRESNIVITCPKTETSVRLVSIPQPFEKHYRFKRSFCLNP